MDLSDLKVLCFQIKEQKRVVEELDKKKKEENKKLEAMKAEVLAHLEKHELKNFDFGEGKVISVDKFNVKLLDKYAFADYLKKQGRFDSLYTFNYQTVNSFYKEEMEKAIEDNNSDFKVDGLSEPTLYRSLQIRG